MVAEVQVVKGAQNTHYTRIQGCICSVSFDIWLIEIVRHKDEQKVIYIETKQQSLPLVHKI